MMPRRRRHRETQKTLQKLDFPLTCGAGPDGAIVLTTQPCAQPARFFIYGHTCHGHLVTGSDALCARHATEAYQAYMYVAYCDGDLELPCGHTLAHDHILKIEAIQE